MRAVALSFSLFFVTGCLAVDPPDGRLPCHVASDCPPDWVCANAFCFHHAMTMDAGDASAPPDARMTDGGMDAPVIDAHMPDDVGTDANRDAGPPCTSASDCDDHNACTGTESCSASGVCLAGVPLDCSDGISCTSDTCIGASGCLHTPNDSACTAQAGGHCDATLDCQYASCSSATCADDAASCTHGVCNGLVCDHVSTCTGAQMCCGGACVAAGCDDGIACTDDTCGGAGCIHTPNAGRCDDGHDCTDDSCSATTGCVHTNNTDPCDDGSVCTQGDTCRSGFCHGIAIHCPPNEICDDSSGLCTT